MSSRGFTLIELVLALVLASVVGSLVFQLLNSQGRFAEIQSAREEVQQNARAALDVVSGELRVVPRGALQLAADDEIRARVPYAWGLLCGGADGLAMFASPDRIEGVGTLSHFAIQEVPATTTWTVSQPGVAVEGTSGECADLDPASGGPVGDVWEYRVSGSGFDGGGWDVASLVHLYRVIGYDMGESEGFGGIWIRRSVGPPGAQGRLVQPLAGPVSDAGMRFEYFLGDDAAPSTAPGTDAAQLARVTRIRITIATRSSRPSRAETEEASTLIHLRN